MRGGRFHSSTKKLRESVCLGRESPNCEEVQRVHRLESLCQSQGNPVAIHREAEIVVQPKWNDSSPSRSTPVPPDWWFEDVSILRIDHFVRVVTAIRVKGMVSELIGAAIIHYASKWLPSLVKESAASVTLPENEANSISNGGWKGGLHVIVAGNQEIPATVQSKDQRMIVESLVSIIPQQRDCVSCSFLLRLLRMANMLNVAPALVTELEKRVGMQLEHATLSDLLIPCYNTKETIYDVDLVQRLLEHFLVQEQSSPTRQDTKIAVDSYLKAHPTLTEHERKRLCRVMECQKLSVKISNAVALKEGGQSKYQPMVPNRKTLLEGTPQSFQEGWTAAKKDINTFKFELETVKTKYLELQNDMETLQRDFNKLANPKQTSAWTSGWKRLSKITKMTDANDNGTQLPTAEHTRKTPRRWRNSIS
ncbi:hypothetical protein SASPL_101211 [Salvia splendens]|uniref:NPH3 domain-containing protein n=1 Tax=Salvia splendens TaxID=180675 RepID=A0A8X9AD62_SALSN|nr:hypothetical protein SASPL_101211 [Salvia splendens]